MCEHVWIVILWEYAYPGVQSLRPDSLVAKKMKCGNCGDLVEVDHEQSKEIV